jgi:hypothetical protein
VTDVRDRRMKRDHDSGENGRNTKAPLEGSFCVEALALAYHPTRLPLQYCRRCGVSRPCSGRERVGPPRTVAPEHMHVIESVNKVAQSRRDRRRRKHPIKPT